MELGQFALMCVKKKKKKGASEANRHRVLQKASHYFVSLHSLYGQSALMTKCRMHPCEASRQLCNLYPATLQNGAAGWATERQIATSGHPVLSVYRLLTFRIHEICRSPASVSTVLIIIFRWISQCTYFICCQHSGECKSENIKLNKESYLKTEYVSLEKKKPNILNIHSPNISLKTIPIWTTTNNQFNMFQLTLSVLTIRPVGIIRARSADSWV